MPAKSSFSLPRGQPNNAASFTKAVQCTPRAWGNPTSLNPKVLYYPATKQIKHWFPSRCGHQAGVQKPFRGHAVDSENHPENGESQTSLAQASTAARQQLSTAPGSPPVKQMCPGHQTTMLHNCLQEAEVPFTAPSLQPERDRSSFNP